MLIKITPSLAPLPYALPFFETQSGRGERPGKLMMGRYDILISKLRLSVHVLGIARNDEQSQLLSLVGFVCLSYVLYVLC